MRGNGRHVLVNKQGRERRQEVEIGKQTREGLTVWIIGINPYCHCCKESFTVLRIIEILLCVCYSIDSNQGNELLFLFIDGIVNYVNVKVYDLSHCRHSKESVLEISIVAKVISCT